MSETRLNTPPGYWTRLRREWYPKAGDPGPKVVAPAASASTPAKQPKRPGSIGPAAGRPRANPFAHQVRLAGVLVTYKSHPHLKVKSIWTRTRLYPYPNLRRKLGLKGSYDHADGQVVDWGKHHPPAGMY